MKYIFLFTLSPVKSFIAQARKTQDLYAGSLILSELTQTAAIEAKNQGINLDFPTKIDENTEGVSSFPNTKSGEILATNGDADVKQDIEKALNLNNKILITARRNVIDIAKEQLLSEKPIQQWNKAFLQKHLDK